MAMLPLLLLALLTIGLTVAFTPSARPSSLRYALSLHAKRRSNISKLSKPAPTASTPAPAAPIPSMDPAKVAAATTSSSPVSSTGTGTGTAEEPSYATSPSSSFEKSNVASGVSATYEQEVKSSINADMDALNSRLLEVADQRKQPAQEENGIIAKGKDILSLVLVADFFLIIFFLVWFLAAAATKDSNPFLLERFQDIFQPVVVPSLTVLMAGSIASGVTGNKDD